MDKRVLIAAPVHQSERIFKEYLEHINKIEIPNEYEINKFFILHNCSELKKFLKEEEYIIIEDEIKYKEFDHQFTNEHFSILAKMRSYILDYARKNNYDFLYSIDSDVLVHPKSLLLLLQDNLDIAGMINWNTSYSNDNIILPNCYDLEFYHWWRENNNYLKIPGIWETGIISATYLIGPRILQEKRINYYPVKGSKCSEWEDYAFSLRAHCLIPDLHVGIDTRLPSRHLYKEKDYIRWMLDKNKYE